MIDKDEEKKISQGKISLHISIDEFFVNSHFVFFKIVESAETSKDFVKMTNYVLRK